MTQSETNAFAWIVGGVYSQIFWNFTTLFPEHKNPGRPEEAEHCNQEDVELLN